MFTRTPGERLLQLIEKLKITPYQLSKDLGYKRPDSVYTILNNATNISGKFISKLQEIHPTININWLLNGKGEMFNKRIGLGNYGCEIVRGHVIIYPSKLTYEYLKRLAIGISKRIWHHPEEEMFKIEAKKAVVDGIEFKVTEYSFSDNQLSQKKIYSILILPDWQVASFFDYWRVDCETRRCQNLFKLSPESFNELNNAVYESIQPLANFDDDYPQVDPYLKDEEWKEILTNDPRINSNLIKKKKRKK